MQRTVLKLPVTIITIIWLFFILQACAQSENPAVSPRLDSDAMAVTRALAELESLAVPEGADPEEFAQLKTVFESLILAGAVNINSKSTSAGLGTDVDDLTVADLGGGTFELAWTYRHLGDYDQNREVNVSDISPVGQYFNASAGSANWNIAQAADGDRNGLVNVSDLTPVGQNFGSVVTGYRIESSTNPGVPDNWIAVTEVEFSLGTRPPGQTLRTFSIQLADRPAGLAYRVIALVTTTGGSGGTSYDEQEDNDTYTTPNVLPVQGVTGLQGSLGSGTGYSAYDGDVDDLFSFSATAGQDVDITLQFNSATADLDLYLLNTSGETLLSSLGTGSTEQILATINISGTFLIAAKCFSGYSDYTLDVTFSGGSGNQAPQAALTANPSAGQSPLIVSFDASGSSDSDGSITRYEWDWEDDGTWDHDSGATPTAQYTYTVATSQSVIARVRVTDNGGLTSTATATVSISAAGFVEPPVQSFVDYSQAGDTAVRKWLLNCYRVLPPWQDGDRCFQNATFSGWADQVLQLTNQERANQGLNPLVYDPHLELVAQSQSRDMALQQYFSHDNLYGMGYAARLDAVDRPAYTPGSGIHGENIYAGRMSPPENTPAQAVNWWMNSPSHRANILNPNVTHLGVGVYYHTGDPSGYYGYFTQLFANWLTDPATNDWLDPAEVPAP